jgi:high affinity Mn2+ porin
LGLCLKGEAFGRPGDTIGLAAAIDGASSANQRFLEAGGQDMLDGDGALRYQPEKALELYYSFQVTQWFHFTLDYQFVADPAFNADRGPVSIFGVRAHFQF